MEPHWKEEEIRLEVDKFFLQLLQDEIAVLNDRKEANKKVIFAV